MEEGIAALLALLLVFGCMVPDYFWLKSMHDKLPMKKPMIVLFSFLLHTFCVISAKAFAALEFQDLHAFVYGMRIYGTILLCPIALCIAAKAGKWKLRDVSDIVSVALMYGLFAIRINCLKNGCCRSVPVTFLGGHRLPIVEAEMLLWAILAVYWLPRVKRGETYGQVYPCLMISYGIFRFIIEWFREEYVPVGSWHMGHIWSLVCLIIGLSACFSIQSQHKARKGVQKRRR